MGHLAKGTSFHARPAPSCGAANLGLQRILRQEDLTLYRANVTNGRHTSNWKANRVVRRIASSESGACRVVSARESMPDGVDQ